jgi:hypothetical protein
MDYILRIVLFGAVLAFCSGAKTLKRTFNGPYGATGSSAGITSGRVLDILVDPRKCEYDLRRRAPPILRSSIPAARISQKTM